MDNTLVEKFKKYLQSREAENIEKKIHDFELLLANKYDKDTVVDEIGDFYDYICGRPFRWTAFARYIQTRYCLDKYKHILDIGCGREAYTSQELLKRGYDVVGIDPKVKEVGCLRVIKGYFNYLLTNVSEYDLLVGLEPCDGTEHIIRSALKNDKEFVVVPCYAPHNSIDGIIFKDYQTYHSYLLKISNEIMIDEVKILNKSLTIIKRK
jgi:SAM-dependent methyltransferase